MPAKHIATYLRVSTQLQATGLESQRRAVAFDVERIQGSGAESQVREYVDFGISGAKASRPGLDRLMADVHAGLVSHVVVYSYSRLFRSTTHLIQALQVFEGLGVVFVSTTERIDTSTNVGKLVFTFLAGLSEFERELTRERVINGLRNARMKGIALGRPSKADRVAIVKMLDSGSTYRAISKQLGVSMSTITWAKRSAPETIARAACTGE